MPSYPFETLAFGTLLEIVPGIHWLRMPMPFPLDHINLWLLEDGDSWTLVDTGYNTEEVRGYGRAAQRACLCLIQDGSAKCCSIPHKREATDTNVLRLLR